MARLYCPKISIQDKHIVVGERKQIHYICDVLRLEEGDDITAFDGQGNEYKCRISELSNRKALFMIKEKVMRKTQYRTNLTVACAIPRQRGKFDDMVDKLSQLGVDKIIPMITERVIIRWSSKQKQHHQQRWRKISEQACIQSGRNDLPIIESIKDISQILAHPGTYDLKLIPTPVEKKRNLRDILDSGPMPRDILVLIGPEGDFTSQELAQAQRAGFISIFLGKLVLRVDTAAIAVAAFFRLDESEANPA
jgi:16S rRNA (uracil1498-N3)-methyltransferase